MGLRKRRKIIAIHVLPLATVCFLWLASYAVHTQFVWAAGPNACGIVNDNGGLQFRIINRPMLTGLRQLRGIFNGDENRERGIMSKVFVNIGLSLDGYMAPEGMAIEHWDKPQYKNWGAKWGAMMGWILKQQYFRENLKFGPGGETGPVNDMLRNTMERSGANIMGKRMFEQGERSWPEDAPFHTPVYVLTHEKREPWVRPGGTTFYFVNDGPASALEKARASAGGRDIRISGGADVVQQYLSLGAIDELEIALAPILFGNGRRLFENLHETPPQFRIDKVLPTPDATHLRYVRA